MEIVFISQILEREVARTVNDPNDGSVLNPLAVLAVMFSGLVFQSRRRVSSGDHFITATRAMSDQVGRVGNNPGDLEEVKTLQLLIAHVAKLAIEVEKENGTGDGSDLKLVVKFKRVCWYYCWFQ